MLLSRRPFRARVRDRWQRLRPVTRHWLTNVAIGVLIELLLHWAGHTLHWQPLVYAQNYALDAVMRANAAVDPTPSFPNHRVPLSLALIDIDDAAWRSAQWGGGEPYRAPRQQLLALVDKAFEAGARQVVLDVVVEGAARPQEIADEVVHDGQVRAHEFFLSRFRDCGRTWRDGHAPLSAPGFRALKEYRQL